MGRLLPLDSDEVPHQHELAFVRGRGLMGRPSCSLIPTCECDPTAAAEERPRDAS